MSEPVDNKELLAMEAFSSSTITLVSTLLSPHDNHANESPTETFTAANGSFFTVVSV